MFREFLSDQVTKLRAFQWFMEVFTTRERKGGDSSYAIVTFLLKGIMPEWMKLQFIVLQQLYFQLRLKQASVASQYFLHRKRE